MTTVTAAQCSAIRGARGARCSAGAGTRGRRARWTTGTATNTATHSHVGLVGDEAVGPQHEDQHERGRAHQVAEQRRAQAPSPRRGRRCAARARRHRHRARWLRAWEQRALRTSAAGRRSPIECVSSPDAGPLRRGPIRTFRVSPATDVFRTAADASSLSGAAQVAAGRTAGRPQPYSRPAVSAMKSCGKPSATRSPRRGVSSPRRELHAERAEVVLERTRIRAPTIGRIGDRRVRPIVPAKVIAPRIGSDSLHARSDPQSAR